MPLTPILGRAVGGFGAIKGVWGAPEAIDWGQIATAVSGAGLSGTVAAHFGRRTVVDQPIDFGIPDVPVETPQLPPPEGGIRTVLSGPAGGGALYVPPPTARVDPVSGESIESYENGDYPAGSIFAPGRTWGSDPVGEFDAPIHEEEPRMAHDWGHLLRQGIGAAVGIPGYEGAGAIPAGFAPGATTIPGGQAASLPSAAPVIGADGCDPCGNRRYVTLDRQTGKISCRRRRRPRLLTDRDLGDLAALKTITGNNDALKMAVIKAVR